MNRAMPENLTVSAPIGASMKLDGEFRYFKGIDGLRALAVITVMLFHLDKNLLPGGYIGVDVFFVISGFVVTASVLHLKFKSLWDFQSYFYARRIKRILPALLFCMLATSFAVVLFIPESWLGRSIYDVGATALLGASNIALMLQKDTYFSPTAEFNPYLHTWSLGVEEQFYLIYPVLMYFVLREAGRHRLALPLIGALTLLSFALCGLFTLTDHWKAAFYSIPARFWELGCGALLCLTIESWRPALAQTPTRLITTLSLVSLAIVAIALAIPASDFFPFPLALLPVLATCGLIAVLVARSETLVVAPFLSRSCIYIGRISYSLYLWHWPIYVLMRWTVGLSEPWQYAFAFSATFALGALSYHLVEQPFRRSPSIRHVSRRYVIAAGLAAMICATAGTRGLFAMQRDLSLSQTAANHELWYPSGESFEPRQGDCTISTTEAPFEGGAVYSWTPTNCSAPGRLIAAGDSHALAYTGMLEEYAKRSGHIVQLYYKADCAYLLPPKPSVYEKRCGTYHRAVTKALFKHFDSNDVLFLASFRLRHLINPSGELNAPAVEQPSVERQLSPYLREAHLILSRLAKSGGQIIIEAPTPVFRTLPFRCSDWFNRDNPDCRAGATVSRVEMLRFREPMMIRMRMLARTIPNITIWDPLPILCPASQCSAFKDDLPLFSDGDHISGFSNRLLFPHFVQVPKHGVASAKLVMNLRPSS